MNYIYKILQPKSLFQNSVNSHREPLLFFYEVELSWRKGAEAFLLYGIMLHSDRGREGPLLNVFHSTTKAFLSFLISREDVFLRKQKEQTGS